MPGRAAGFTIAKACPGCGREYDASGKCPCGYDQLRLLPVLPPDPRRTRPPKSDIPANPTFRHPDERDIPTFRQTRPPTKPRKARPTTEPRKAKKTAAKPAAEWAQPEPGRPRAPEEWTAADRRILSTQCQAEESRFLEQCNQRAHQRTLRLVERIEEREENRRWLRWPLPADVMDLRKLGFVCGARGE